MPRYIDIEEIPPEYIDKNMRFFVKCQALGKESIGGGVTKKIAKHTSAERLLQKYFNNDIDDMDDNSDMMDVQTVDSNHITDLLDYCVVKNFKKPDFVTIKNFGPV